MEAEATDATARSMLRWSPLAPRRAAEDAVEAIADALAGARSARWSSPPMSGAIRRRSRALVRLCERLGVGVLESAPGAMNFPHDNPLYQGSHWNHPFQNAALAEADVILVLDSDVPWVPPSAGPNPAARIFHIDVDPLKPSMPLWYIDAHATFRADAATALAQLNRHLDGRTIDAREGRRAPRALRRARTPSAPAALRKAGERRAATPSRRHS